MKTTLDRIVEHKSLLIFAGGAVAAIVGKQILESEATKKFCINTAVKVMQMRDEAEETFQNIKENAEDIHHDAKEKTKKEIYVEEIDDKPKKHEI